MRRLHISGLGLVRDHLEVEAVLVSAEGLVVLLDDTRSILYALSSPVSCIWPFAFLYFCALYICFCHEKYMLLFFFWILKSS